MSLFLIEDPYCEDNPFKVHEARDDVHFVLYHGTSSIFCDDIERIGFCFDNFKREFGEPVCAIVDACKQIHYLPNGFAPASLITVNDKTVWFTPQFSLARRYASNLGSECIDGAIRAANDFLAFVRDSNRVGQRIDHWSNVLKDGHHAETQRVLDNLQDTQLIEKLSQQVEMAQVFLKGKNERAFPVVYAVLADFSALDKTTLSELRRRQRNGIGIQDQRGSDINIKGIVGRVDFPKGITPKSI